jgi:hypothetical protein
LLDSGGAEKLERFGPVVLRRPDPQALWSKSLDDAQWARADLVFVRESDRGGRWEARAGAAREAVGREPRWTVRYREGVFAIRPTPFKHVGLFPEQATNWERVARAFGEFGAERPRLLNLFGYTGAASVLAAQNGYEVTQRVREVCVRIALGTRPADVVRLLLGRSLVMALCGVIAGLILAFALSATIESLLFDTSAHDPFAFFAAAAIAALACALATLVPARHASRTPPATVLST